MIQQLLPRPSRKSPHSAAHRTPRTDSTGPLPGGLRSIARLQQTLGNRRVAQLTRARYLAGREGVAAAPHVERQVGLSKGHGSALPGSVRAYMEPRFGRDFSRVRVHTGGDAQRMNEAIGANAFTHGTDIYFGAGRSPGNLRLMAHELAHVVQQTGGGVQRADHGPVLQRDTKTDVKPAPQDYAVLLSPDEDFVTLARAIAPNAVLLHATSADDLLKQLKGIKGPIRTLFFVAHMTDDGNLMFESPSVKDFVQAEAIAAKIKGSVQVENIDLRGCSIAQAPAEMEKIRAALKASRITGLTCTMVKQIAQPVKVNGKPITKPEQLNDTTVSAAFDTGLKNTRELFVDNKKKCIINDSRDGYFQTGGKLIALWVNPESMADETAWDDKKSICVKDLKVEKIDPTKKFPVIDPEKCKIVEVSK